jgi:conjugal transfer pilus assembly protein TraE
MNKTQLLQEAALRLGVRTSVLALLALLALSNAALALKLVTDEREQRIELQLPGTLTQDAWVSTRKVSPEFLLDTGFLIAELALNLNPATADGQLKLIKHYAAPEYAGAVEQAFAQAAQRLRTENASTVFWPTSYTVDPTGASRVAITGTLATYVGDKRVTEAPKTYRIAMRWARWRAAFTEFAEVDPKNPFAPASPAPANTTGS